MTVGTRRRRTPESVTVTSPEGVVYAGDFTPDPPEAVEDAPETSETDQADLNPDDALTGSENTNDDAGDPGA